MKTIRIPTVTKDTTVLINKTGIVQTPKALKVFLKKQTIEGVQIPPGFEIWIPDGNEMNIINPFSSSPSIELPVFKINEILRTLYLQKL